MELQKQRGETGKNRVLGVENMVVKREQMTSEEKHATLETPTHASGTLEKPLDWAELEPFLQKECFAIKVQTMLSCGQSNHISEIQF